MIGNIAAGLGEWRYAWNDDSHGCLNCAICRLVNCFCEGWLRIRTWQRISTRWCTWSHNLWRDHPVYMLFCDTLKQECSWCKHCVMSAVRSNHKFQLDLPQSSKKNNKDLNLSFRWQVQLLDFPQRNKEKVKVAGYIHRSLNNADQWGSSGRRTALRLRNTEQVSHSIRPYTRAADDCAYDGACYINRTCYSDAHVDEPADICYGIEAKVD